MPQNLSFRQVVGPLSVTLFSLRVGVVFTLPVPIRLIPFGSKRIISLTTRRSEGGSRVPGTLSRDRQLQHSSSLCYPRSYSRQLGTPRARELHSRRSVQLLASNIHRQNGARPDVCG